MQSTIPIQDADFMMEENSVLLTEALQKDTIMEAMMMHPGGVDDSECLDAMTDNDPLMATITTTTAGHGTLRQVSAGSSEAPAAETPPPPQQEEELTMTGRPSIPLYLSCNPDYLSAYQCLIRKHMEFFEATPADLETKTKGRNRPIVLGQVGIRCRHCAYIQPDQRTKGSRYYPHTLTGIYQAGQILSQGHWLEEGAFCPYLPAMVQNELRQLRTQKVSASAGKDYWAATASVLGVYEDGHGLRFEHRLGMSRHTTTDDCNKFTPLPKHVPRYQGGPTKTATR